MTQRVFPGLMKFWVLQVPVSKSAQGVTGLEAKRLVPDDRLEVGASNGDDVDGDDDDDEGSSSADSDDSDYIPYKVGFDFSRLTDVFLTQKFS